MATNRILIVEDEPKLLTQLVRTISTEGFSTFTCTTYSELQKILQVNFTRFDAVILDRLLQGKDSAQLVGEIKKHLPGIKVLILSAINTPSEIAGLLDRGADDYLTKPFDRDELIARIRAILRRAETKIQYGNMTLNMDKRTVEINESEILFQNKEFILLVTLLRSPGRVFNKTYLYENVWEMSPEVESNVVEATINKIRRKLEESGATFQIQSMRNKGYWIEE